MEKDQQPSVNLIQAEEATEESDEHKLRKEELIKKLNQRESDEKKLWKERLRKEILEEEKQRILNFVNSEVTKKIFEVEKLLEVGGKPAKLVLVPIDRKNLPKGNLLSEQNGGLCYRLTDTGNGIKGSELESNLAKENSAQNRKIAVEATKTEDQQSEQKHQSRPNKKQKIIGCTWSCPLCNVTATSEANLNNHFMGKKHRLKSTEVMKSLNNQSSSVAKKDDVLMSNGLQVKIQANGRLFLVYKRGNVMWCKNNGCGGFSCTNSAEMVVHLTESKHDVVCENAEEVKVADD